ncbi:Type 1 phosphatases regulator ypi1 [Gaertneriomyces sp. JEL0708]|nr:Type 1 phosphatases regulator ypi1 [Gaertneriomyces sp. JEL0708]
MESQNAPNHNTAAGAAGSQVRTAPILAGSQTITINNTIVPVPPAGTLLLRGGNVNDRKVQWDDSVVDNEGLGKKSSKVCCIYRKPHNPDSSDSDSDSDSDSSGDDDPSKPNAYEREPKSVRKKRSEKTKRRQQHEHNHDGQCSHHAR